ncbi:hypothetical protein ACQQXD_004273 [Escherichia coli]
MTALNKQALRKTAEKAQEHGVFNMDIHSQTVLALLDELEAKDKQISLDVQIKARLCRESNSLHDRLRVAEKRIAELEATQGNPVMFIDGDISPADADKLAAVIREFNEETETPAARMARIIRENPHPTNMCDMPAAAAGKGE